MLLRGHWTISASSQDFFKKVEIFIQLEVLYIYAVTACSILLATSTQLQRYIFLSVAIFKSRLLKMAATVMIVEFGTIHHYSSVEENSEACLCSSLDRYKN